MVLQERIELSTSPLPRECSTTELLQRPNPGGERNVVADGGLLPQADGQRKNACAAGARRWELRGADAQQIVKMDDADGAADVHDD